MSDTFELLVSWAWERHHNVLSWYIRPLFLLPYCWFAYRRNAAGIVVTLIALVTSMAWFPAPANPDPAVVRMLAVEREYLLGVWTPAKLALAAVVPLTFVALAAALWRRSVGWALVVVNAAVGVKIAWTFAVDAGGAGALAHLPAALLGLAAVDLVLVWWWSRRRHARRSGRPATGAHRAPVVPISPGGLSSARSTAPATGTRSAAGAPSNTSTSGTEPFTPTSGVCASTSTIGSRRRAAAISSPSRVCAFSRTSSRSTSACQVSRSTISGVG